MDAGLGTCRGERDRRAPLACRGPIPRDWLFTDVVGSTELLARIGDTEYRALRATHEREVRLEVEQRGGRLVSVTGDGTLSVFDGPTHAVRCADGIRKAATKLGIAVRSGVHTGELERTAGDLTGLACTSARRVGAMATADEALVSRTVFDLAAGQDLLSSNAANAR